MASRCVCGRSATFPVCDASHGDGWACGTNVGLQLVVVAGPHLHSLGERLAHARGGELVTSAPVGHVAELVVLSDGSDLSQLKRVALSIAADRRRLVVVDAPASVGLAFPGFEVHQACPTNPLHLWRAVIQALDDGVVLSTTPLMSGFLSHAVQDEPVLQGAVDYLRDELGAQLFMCADSISPGRAWKADIEAALASSDRYVYLGSAAATLSTYCAFEAGFASALGKPIRVILCDETPVPAFLSSIQAVSVPRTLRRRPWLTEHEVIVDALLDALDGSSIG